mmetsp:Transcript_40282/g.106705  ORF Transcript_40282/g.106705 Transcript_40282/m.106705 type:complete len:227 (+) Transcript_40282:338-1018(+)|eukprot:CAMPEP_0115841462 /NCGR_PEP_ID=MMETSP0287-20121206/7301_1 /TAXON_ID=412157 /ORGANISM="Chrysochromulina rotalis, Strain UIO044" /LENGTH=226 /DNA_ID=CAMNT_0003295109 /DNA_START=286 /DNA_END=966 /DNA_ORIENTATION=-
MYFAALSDPTIALFTAASTPSEMYITAVWNRFGRTAPKKVHSKHKIRATQLHVTIATMVESSTVDGGLIFERVGAGRTVVVVVMPAVPGLSTRRPISLPKAACSPDAVSGRLLTSCKTALAATSSKSWLVNVIFTLPASMAICVLLSVNGQSPVRMAPAPDCRRSDSMHTISTYATTSAVFTWSSNMDKSPSATKVNVTKKVWTTSELSRPPGGNSGGGGDGGSKS